MIQASSFVRNDMDAVIRVPSSWHCHEETVEENFLSIVLEYGG